MAIDQAQQDAEHLKLLSVFHYVVAGIQALWGSFPLIHFGIGLALLLNPEVGKDADRIPIQFVGWFFTLFAGVWILTGWTLAVCLVVAARSIARRRRRLFCIVVAGLTSVTCMPFGTVLGVFTIMVLLRPSVQELFEPHPA